MAFVADQNDEEKKGGMGVTQTDPNSQQQPQENQPTQVSGPGSVTSAPISGQTNQPSQPTPAPSQPQTSNAPKGSGFFTNIQKYVQANQPQAQKIVSNIGQQLGKQTQEAQGILSKQQEQLGQRLQQAGEKLQSAQQFGQQQIEKAATQGTVDQQDVSRFRDLVEGRETYGTVQGINVGQAKELADRAKALSSIADRDAGRAQLLQQTFGINKYTSGQKNLDDLILKGASPELEALKGQTRETAQNILTNVSDARRQAAQRLMDIQNRDIELRKNLETQLGQKKTGLEEALAKRAQERQAEVESLSQRLREGKLTQQEAETLGLKQGDLYFGEDIGQGGVAFDPYLKPLKATAENVITEQEIQQANALSSLAGKQMRDFLVDARANGFDADKVQQLGQLKQGIKDYTNKVSNTIKQETRTNAIRGLFSSVINPDLQQYDLQNDIGKASFEREIMQQDANGNWQPTGKTIDKFTENNINSQTSNILKSVGPAAFGLTNNDKIVGTGPGYVIKETYGVVPGAGRGGASYGNIQTKVPVLGQYANMLNAEKARNEAIASLQPMFNRINNPLANLSEADKQRFNIKPIEILNQQVQQGEQLAAQQGITVGDIGTSQVTNNPDGTVTGYQAKDGAIIRKRKLLQNLMNRK